MTFEKSQTLLATICREQKTDKPLVKVKYAGAVFEGRVARTDRNVERCRELNSPYGLMVLESPGLGRGPETILQIAEIPDDGLISLKD